MKSATDMSEAVRSKLLLYGTDAVTTDDLFRLLLSYASSRNKKAKAEKLSYELLSAYPTPKKCFSAVRTPGFSERFGKELSDFLLLCDDIAGQYRKEQYGGFVCRDAEDFARVFVDAYRYIDKEATLLLLLDNRMRSLSLEYVADGSFTSAAFRPDAVIRTALLRHASAAVIAVNRRKGIAVPTEEELHAVAHIKSSMEKAGIPLLSGILVAGSRHAVLSLNENKAVKPLSKNELAAHLAADAELTLPERDEVRREGQNALLSLLSYGEPKGAEGILIGLLRRGFDLRRVLFSETAELLASEGMTKECAALIVALGELLRRMNTAGYRTGKPLDELSAALLVRELSEGNVAESVYLLLVDAARRLIAVENMGCGVANAAVVLPRRLLELAVYHGASGAYLLHTHPNGASTPSKQDVSVTRSLMESFSDAACPLLEHIVVTEKSYTPILSYMKKNRMNE